MRVPIKTFCDSGIIQDPDFILGQVAKLINTSPMSVIQAMSMAGYRFNGNTRGELVEAVAIVLAESPKFQALIAPLIGLENGLITYGQVVMAGRQPQVLNDHGAASGAKPYQYYNATDMIGSIFEGIGNSIRGASEAAASALNLKTAKTTSAASLEVAKIQAEAGKEMEQQQTKQALLSALAAKASNPNYGAKPISSGAVIAIMFVSVIALIAVVAIYKMKTRPATMEAGGVTPPAPPPAPPVVNPIPEPVIPAAPAAGTNVPPVSPPLPTV